jgi:uncharacterized delta-60 repeat protein
MTLFLLLMISCAVVTIACSNGKSPVEPATEDMSGISGDLPESSVADIQNRNLLAVYDAVIDPVAQTFTVTPDNRTAQYHFPLTQVFPNVLKITGYGWTPNFWADIKLVHPFPGSGIDAFDPRVIAILPANPGNYFYYPNASVHGNPNIVIEPDGYTKLFDYLDSSIPGNTNPFKAYFKNQPSRVWSGTGVTEETQRWQMNLSGFGGSLKYKLIVDVSTNFPNPPQPGLDNAPEPVGISSSVGQGLSNLGGSADITVTLLDWQGQSSIGDVLIEAPDLFNGMINLTYSAPGPNPSEFIFTGTIENSLVAPAREYKYLVAANDLATGIYMYNMFNASVSYVAYGENLIWAKRAGGTGGDYAQGITALSDNSTVVTGFFAGSATFGSGDPNEIILTSVGAKDIFIARYNPDGTLAWAKRAGGLYNDYGQKITALSDNSTVITGYFFSIATFGEGEPNETILTSAGGYEYSDIFIAQYNPDGTLSWAKRAGGSNVAQSYGITSLSDDSTVLTGCFKDSITFGPDEPNETVLTSASAGYEDIFIARYNSDGTLSWAKRAGGIDGDRGNGITSLSDNSTVVTGYFQESATFGPGETNQKTISANGIYYDVFIARYNPDGTLAWVKDTSSTGVSSCEGTGITKLSNNSIAVTGQFEGSVTFGSGKSLHSAGRLDIFVARYTSDGTLVWAKRYGGNEQDHDPDITALTDDSTVITGTYSGTTTFGSFDILVFRFSPDGSLIWTKTAGGSDLDFGTAITVLSDNSTVVAGYFGYIHGESATFGLGEINETVLTSAGASEIFIARFAP